MDSLYICHSFKSNSYMREFKITFIIVFKGDLNFLIFNNLIKKSDIEKTLCFVKRIYFIYYAIYIIK